MATAFTTTAIPFTLTAGRSLPTFRPPAFVSVRSSGSSSSSSSKAVGSSAVSSGTKPLRGIMKPRPVSPEMQAIVGMPEIPRTQALKLIWAYIKENNLQDPENKKIILCDEKLKNIFGGREQVGFLEVAGLITPHFAK